MMERLSKAIERRDKLNTMPEIVCAPQSEVAVLFELSRLINSEVEVLFNWNLSRQPFLRQVVKLDLLHCTGLDWNILMVLCPIFTQRLMKDRRIEQSLEHCLDR